MNLLILSTLTSFANKQRNLDFAIKLPKQSRANKYFINLLDNKQLFYSLIYNLGLVRLEILKIYTKVN